MKPCLSDLQVDFGPVRTPNTPTEFKGFRCSLFATCMAEASQSKSAGEGMEPRSQMQGWKVRTVVMTHRENMELKRRKIGVVPL